MSQVVVSSVSYRVELEGHVVGVGSSERRLLHPLERGKIAAAVVDLRGLLKADLGSSGANIRLSFGELDTIGAALGRIEEELYSVGRSEPEATQPMSDGEEFHFVARAFRTRHDTLMAEIERELRADGDHSVEGRFAIEPGSLLLAGFLTVASPVAGAVAKGVGEVVEEQFQEYLGTLAAGIRSAVERATQRFFKQWFQAPEMRAMRALEPSISVEPRRAEPQPDDAAATPAPHVPSDAPPGGAGAATPAAPVAAPAAVTAAGLRMWAAGATIALLLLLLVVVFLANFEIRRVGDGLSTESPSTTTTQQTAAGS